MMLPQINEKSDLIIASFVPALLRKQFKIAPNRKPKSELLGDQAALLWIDICDFSLLSNRLLLNHAKGVEQLSRILQNHYDHVLKQFLKFGGEPMVFAGDGVLAAWHCTSSELPGKTKDAIACASSLLDIQSASDDLGQPLSLHVVTACGPCQLLELGGSDHRWLYTVLGDSLNDLRQTSRNRQPGKVLLSPAVITSLGRQIKYIPAEHNCGILDAPVRGSHPAPKAGSISLEAEAVKSLKLYLPKAISPDLNFDQLKWIDELRPVTIVFTQLHSVVPNVNVAAGLLQNVVKIITPIVAKHDGILNQVWVDEKAANILIIFGPPPSAHRDNPARGLRTALDIKQALSKTEFINSVGVTSGKAFCGLLGNDTFRQYTVIGDVVNLGARLAQLQTENICCDEATVKATRDEFTFNQPNLVTIKGLSQKERVWELESGTVRQTIEPNEIPLVGREQELLFLRDCYSTALSGECVSVVLEGESGLGKSKLLGVFQNDIKSKGGLVLTGSGDPVERGIPYSGWKKIFSNLMGLEDAADKQTKQDLITEFLGDELSELASLLNIIFTFDFPESDIVRSFTIQQRFTETKKLLVELINRHAKKRPLLIIIDDAVWLDHASWKLAVEIAAKVYGCFLIVSVQTTQGLKELQSLKDAGAIHYKLEGLSNGYLLKLITAALGVSEVPDKIIETLTSLSKGNPFFCFELIQSLINEKAVLVTNGECSLDSIIDLDNFPLPETIQGTLSRRIDSLEHGPKLALKVASVTGLRFPTDLVQTIFPIPQEKALVPSFLVKDNSMGLLWHDMIDGSRGYAFNNSITRDVAYEMLLFEQKQELHLQIAQWYEKIYADNQAPFYARLAYHWEKAGNNIKAADYLEKQAIRLFSSGFAKQSVETGLRGVELLGVEIVREPNEIGLRIGENMAIIAGLMANRAPSELLLLKTLTDTQTELVITMLLRIGPFAFQSKQIDLFALISVTCLRMTLEHGSSKSVADVYSMYSVIYKGMTGDHIGAYQWSDLAMQADKKNNNTLFSSVAFVHTWFHNHWVNPLPASLLLALQAADAGFKAGDILFACFNLSGYVVYLTACGRPLLEVMDVARAHLSNNQKRVMNAAFHLILELQFAKALAGETNDYLSLTDDEYIEETDISSICNTELGNQIGYYLVARVKLHTHFGKWQDALLWAEQSMPLLKAFEGQIAEIDLVQYRTVAALTGLAKGDFDDRKKLTELAMDSLQIMRRWAAMCPANFQHKALFLEAFLAGVEGDADKSELLFAEAGKLAVTGGFLNDIAQINECRLILQKSRNEILTALKSTLDSYQNWGAYGKVEYLRKLYEVP
ncbi:AAA family ATPase [Flavihumibacter sp. R14]|nr:AAA family ATPase [Flavihumibacter soli]